MRRRRHLPRSLTPARPLHRLNADGFAALERGKSRLGATSSVLSLAEIASLAASAGFSGEDLPIAVAVARSESSGDPRAHNPEGSYGLWQIFVPAHPEFAAAASSGQLNDPAFNAGAAFKVYSDAGYSFYPWTDYKNGKYLAWLPASEQAVLADARGEFAPGSFDQAAAVTDLPPGAADLTTSTSPAMLLLAVGAAVLGVKMVVDLFD